jgi:hypothetical protein
MTNPTPPNRGQGKGYYSPNTKVYEGYYSGRRSVISYVKDASILTVGALNGSKFINRLKSAIVNTINLAKSIKVVSLNRLAKVIQTSFEGILNSFESLITANYYPSYWYKMNESSGAIINYGSTGTANNLGTTRNITYRQSSPVQSNGGYALSFNGSSSYAELVTSTPAPPPLDGITAKYLTLGAWVNFSSTVTSYIVSWGNPQAGSRQGFVLRYNSSTTALEFLWNDGFRASNLFYSGFTPKLNSWYYIYVTFVANGYAYFYVYSKDDSSLGYAYGNYNSSIYWATNPNLFIGSQTTSTNFFQGSISEVTISFGNTQFSTISNSLNAPALGTVSQLCYNAGTGNGPSAVQKNLALIKASKAIVVSLSSAVRVASLIKKSIANSTPLTLVKKNLSFIRRSTAMRVSLFYEGRVRNLVKLVSTSSIRLSNTVKSLSYFRKSKALRVSRATVPKSKKNVKNSLALATRLVLNSKLLTRRKSAIVIEAAAATVTRRKVRIKGVTVMSVYRIGTTKRKTIFRRAVASVIGLAKYTTARVTNFRHIADIPSQVNYPTANSYVITSNLQDGPVVGESTNNFDDTPVNYSESPTLEPVNYLEDPILAPNDYTLPDNPEGEAIIPNIG